MVEKGIEIDPIEIPKNIDNIRNDTDKK